MPEEKEGLIERIGSTQFSMVKFDGRSERQT